PGVPAPDAAPAERRRLATGIGTRGGGIGTPGEASRTAGDRRPSRPAGEPSPERSRQDGVPDLGDRLRAGRCADGGGRAAVHRQPGPSLHVVPRPRVEFLPGDPPYVGALVLLLIDRARSAP